MTNRRFFILLMALLVLGAGILPGAQDTAAKTFKVKVTAEQANLREKPDIGSAIIQQIPEGTILEADRKDGEWFLVRYALEDGGVIAGYIHESLVIVLDQAQVPAAKPETEPRPGSEPRRLPPGERPAGGSGWLRSLLPVDIFLSAGGSSIIADDINKGAQGLAGYNGAIVGFPASGSVSPLRMTILLGVEVFYRVNPRLAIGLGSDYLSGRRSSQVSYPTGDLSLLTPQTATKPSLQAVPFKVGIRFYPRPDFYIRGSLAYYTAKAGYDYRFVASDVSLQEWKGRATAHAVGMEVAVGGEWRVGPRLFFFSEAGFRLAQLNRFAGTGTFRDSGGASTTESGPLFYYQARGADGQSYSLLFVRSAAPSGSDILGARKAELGLTGMIIRAGVKFRF